jgi:small subunit ribosomal protein S4
MNRKNQPKGKLVRALGINIFEQPKYDRLMKKKAYGPGMHGNKRRRIKETEYGRQLKEKQKLKFAYGLSERQFRNIFDRAKRMGGVTGDNMLALLERRLDNVVYRMGIATTRAQARQLVNHGHIHMNGRKVNIPSVTVRPGDEINLREKEATKKIVREFMNQNSKARPAWLEFSEDDIKGKIIRHPERVDIPTLANEQLVVEYYAK